MRVDFTSSTKHDNELQEAKSFIELKVTAELGDNSLCVH